MFIQQCNLSYKFPNAFLLENYDLPNSKQADPCLSGQTLQNAIGILQRNKKVWFELTKDQDKNVHKQKKFIEFRKPTLNLKGKEN